MCAQGAPPAPAGGKPITVIVSLPPGGEAEWFIHPVSARVFVLRGNLTVESRNGAREKFKSGQSFFQECMEWFCCINEGKKPLRFMLVLSRGPVSLVSQPIN